MTFASRYTKFLNTLEEISEEYDELTDTDVRERLHEVINWYFIWGKPVDNDFPKLYGMFSPEGDARVARAVRSFVEEASVIAANLEFGMERNATIENPEITTESGNSYDLFLGSADVVLPPRKPASDDLYGDYNG